MIEKAIILLPKWAQEEIVFLERERFSKGVTIERLTAKNDRLREALEKIKFLYVSPVGDIACQMREIATEALQEAEG